ncbi:MAG TPA: HAD-IA family hydrolase [Vicinamibacterales bacterium]|nr:HAD-IA family hydrolase [Vicinamibacterales bacterium]
MMTTTVLFDFDLTLADSSAAVVECVRFALHGLGLGTVEVGAIHRTVGLSLSDSLRVLTGHNDPVLAESFSKLFVERADEVMVSSTTLYPRSAFVLGVLRERGIGTAIVSTKFRYRIQAILAAADVRDAVDVIVGGEDVAQHKPHPEALRRALAQLGVDPTHALYVGDHPIDGVAAKNAGVRFVRVMTGADHGELAWAAIDRYATIENIGGVLDLRDVIPAIHPSAV